MQYCKNMGVLQGLKITKPHTAQQVPSTLLQQIAIGNSLPDSADYRPATLASSVLARLDLRFRSRTIIGQLGPLPLGLNGKCNGIFLQ